jgi:hypothetical protein
MKESSYKDKGRKDNMEKLILGSGIEGAEIMIINLADEDQKPLREKYNIHTLPLIIAYKDGKQAL